MILIKVQLVGCPYYKIEAFSIFGKASIFSDTPEKRLPIVFFERLGKLVEICIMDRAYHQGFSNLPFALSLMISTHGNWNE